MTWWEAPDPEGQSSSEDASKMAALEAFSSLANCLNAPDRSIFYAEDLLTQELASDQWCSSCPVRVECLKYALLYNEEFGVWGGTTEVDRKSLRRKLYRRTAGGTRGREAVFRLAEHLTVTGALWVDADTLWRVRYSVPIEERVEPFVAPEVHSMTSEMGKGVVVGTEWPPK